jgi:hypothetical protein
LKIEKGKRKGKIDMNSRAKIMIVCIIILLQGVLFSWCAFCYPKNNTCPAAFASSNTECVSRENSEQDKSGQNQQSKSSGRSRPRIGAT